MALVVYWPRLHGSPVLPSPSATKQDAPDAEAAVCCLRGFRADTATFCVVGFRSRSESDDFIGKFYWEADSKIDACGQQSDAPREFLIATARGCGATSSPVVALCAASATALEKVELRRTRCKIVFYDLELAAGGVFALERRRLLATACSGSSDASQSPSSVRSPFVHAPALLDQIGQRHVREERQSHRDTRTRLARIKGGAVAFAEAAGVYATYAPFAVLSVFATAINAVVARLHAPLWLPLVGGKSLEDGSLLLALANRRLAGVATWPKRVRHYYRLNKSRSLTYQEKLETLQLVDFVLMVAIDVVVGYFLASVGSSFLWTRGENHPASIIISAPVHFLRLLRANVAWLMGAPAGFKLNRPLATILGNGVLLWLDMWEFCFSSGLSTLAGTFGIEGVGPGGAVATASDSQMIPHLLWMAWSVMGVTLQLSLLGDAVAVCTWSSRWVYQYFAKLNRLQRGLFLSLWRLFVGKKKNVLRQRVDSQEYDVSQLLLGTLMFTILVFIATTTLVFFIFFLLVRTGVLACLALLKAPIVTIHALPVATLALRLCRPRFFAAGMQLEPLGGDRYDHARPKTVEVTICNVGVGSSATDDRRRRRAIRDAVAALDDAEQDGPDERTEATVSTLVSVADATECAYFQLKPIAVAPGSLLTRLRRYLAKPSAPPQDKEDSHKTDVDSNWSVLSILCDLPPSYWPRVGGGDPTDWPKQG